ncbi:hypothetical protein LTR84_007137 [Exophiala bonariae]|uniref:FAD-binding domain-containing protein n=1 Tax=Exophiala bonariae TaxID=1690606 RepID=A0AAV9MYI3_9EURO|nr:hypothetical protein LTR84_007137 [Exophiala bonariae]
MSRNQENASCDHIDIFAMIIGGGPVGITTALALARYGYSSIILEQHSERLDQPKAHYLNSRTLEILHQLKVDTLPLRKHGLQAEEADSVRFSSSMRGVQFGTIDVKQDEAQIMSPEVAFHVAQPYLEDLLLHEALATGRVEIRRQHQWMDCTKASDGLIISQVLSRITNTTTTLRSKYLLGCDGANGKSREQLGISFRPAMADKEQVLHYASVHFSADLSHLSTGVLWFILSHDRMGVLIAYNRKTSWVYFTSFDPEKTSKDSLTSSYFRALVGEAIGEVPLDYKEIGITVWSTSPRIADTYHSTKVPNGILAGDAAHSFPPTGGLGVNTGIADVQNIAWKIFAIEHGWTEQSFLATISGERRPVALENATQSKINEGKIFRLAAAILKPGILAEELMADPNCRQQIKDAIDDNWEHFHSPDLELGYVYGGSRTRGPADYKKEFIPGVRLPHIWVCCRGQKVSTLDLISGREFVLLTPEDFTERTTIEVRGVPVIVQQLNRDFEDADACWAAISAQISSAAILVRPDHHIIGIVATVEEAKSALGEYLQANGDKKRAT